MQIKRFDRGLTVVELIVSISVSSIILLALVPIIVSFFGNFGYLMAKLRVNNALLAASSQVEGDLIRSMSMMQKPTINDGTKLNDLPGGSEADYRGTGANSRILILRQPATTKNYSDPSREVIYNSTNDCMSPNTPPVVFESVYFVSGGSLYKRTLSSHDPSQTFCFNQKSYQKTSCKTGSGTDCYQKDIKVLDRVKKFSVEYYNTPIATAPESYASTPDRIPVDATTAKVVLQVEEKTSQGTITQTSTIRRNINY